MTAVLLFKNQYIVAQVGDSRAYIIGDNVRQITEDQSVIAREKKGNLTETQAIHDPRRNILLECVGVSNHVHPDFYEGYIQQGEGILVCTDGFWREQNTEQLKDNLPKNNKTELEIKQILHRLISENIEKGEKDNISAVYVQQSEEGHEGKVAVIGTLIEGKYEILKLIGKGGMSEVYLAMDKNLNKQWAVKEIKNEVMTKIMILLYKVLLQKQI